MKKATIQPNYGLLTLAMELRDQMNDWDRQDEELADAMTSLDASERDKQSEENTRLAILANRSKVVEELIEVERPRNGLLAACKLAMVGFEPVGCEHDPVKNPDPEHCACCALWIAIAKVEGYGLKDSPHTEPG